MANIICYKFTRYRKQKKPKVKCKKYLTIKEYNELIKNKDYDRLAYYSTITDQHIEYLFFKDELERELYEQLTIKIQEGKTNV